ncbi:UPF0545 protein C22orf39 homolog [Callorhinchus milii]|uniref:Synaptic plasticity regulator PANTS n=1 Tax=Callorhinchus milii TaxID=7868 RepID=V9LF98_CALMI|nr:UPF0545 protein C22orf39 homolog [Callorhinchus milii]|eukprot:gi/632980044/ref/XP_007906809.1/ PREDICTED: UPF0545 protein C22orf39 homolog [Callorhinchus milii]
MEAQESWRPPRQCDNYQSEWRCCRSLRNLFHHYYAYGEIPSCQQWKSDYMNCVEWEKHKSQEAKKALLESERKRVKDQKRYSPVWKLRKNPPADWHLPLNDSQQK